MGLALGGAESHHVYDSRDEVLIPVPHQHSGSLIRRSVFAWSWLHTSHYPSFSTLLLTTQSGIGAPLRQELGGPFLPKT